MLAVSGGADSTALLHLAAMARAHLADPAIHVVTVDHGLRAESADEARSVERLCRSYGLPHRTLRWHHRGGRSGNLSAAAREARYDLLGRFAWTVRAGAVVTGHQLDDQIETYLLARARGAEGRALAGMRPVRALRPGVVLARPFLGIAGTRLRATLSQAGIAWCEDPTNRNMHYARARLRAALKDGTVDAEEVPGALEKAGRERVAYDRAVGSAIRSAGITVDESGSIDIVAETMSVLEPELRRAVIGRAITAAGGGLYPPQSDKLARLADRSYAGKGYATLGGARLQWRDGRVAIGREYGREGIGPTEATEGRAWFDRRFVVSGLDAGTMVALGAFARGNATERCLPVLVSPTGEALARHPAIRLWRGGPSNVLYARESVGWRLMADL
ncbi:tRNA lysidine(34) synthetase TilS [Aureimonas altamirensis]|uniref:tRNA lysidine(34) synthetase TilS n=1 Tax=Aureimonas altamirensis TaxID=370622 RepID=UPI002554CEAB|nr:tRNA lysidine(34) synthetase TilS [Aureimonas altamirensis]